MDMDAARFEELVSDALDGVPESLGRLIDNVAVFVEDEAPGDPHLLGLYEGIPNTERSDYGVGFVMPDRIVIYRESICAMCTNEAEVVEQVTITVVHELAHYFGIDDDELDRLGWG